ncbi:hypothetical protein [Streptosporangium carneum]|uniref:Uncharacterized protein n=1 Tax=Streptosporangium carneum TaxID=47481 RepID=A0A9W6HXM7_9ACTN|nr:hypothetical protein [Streptosporangium carneum]GLK07280.1 hypothetical protein GCM10017600_06850 [Streptosporangium carneum]
MQLTYYVAPWDADDAEQPPEEVQARDGLRWGYVAADLDRFTRMALSRQIGLLAFAPAERYEIVWSAVALALYEADRQPAPADLITAGWQAITVAIQTEARHHGRDLIRHKGTTRRSYVMYWDAAAPRHISSPENGIVERLAVDQIWPMLTAGQQEALAALAVHGSVAAAAQALGKSTAAVHVIARAGRLRFKQWWHEGETPSLPWGRDRRRSEPATHCPAGHERTSETSYIKHTMWRGKPKRQIVCRICREERRAGGRS